MATVSSKHPRDQAQDFEGLLNNLQDWELSFKNRDKQMRSDDIGKGKPPSRKNSESVDVNGKQTIKEKKIPDSKYNISQYDQLKEYEALGQLTSGAHSQDSFIDANSEKELGNQFFKKQKFNDAIDCYSRSIALSPTAVAFANRAMAYIKIKRFQDAEKDCTEALNFDDRYIKAYSRRSTARKELGKLKEAIDDAEFALRLEPKNQELKKQFEESKSLLQKEILKKFSGVSPGSVDRSRLGKSNIDKNSIQQNLHRISTISSGDDTREATAETSFKMASTKSDADSNAEALKKKPDYQKQRLKASVQDLAAKAASVAKAEAAKNIVPPTSAYQFEVDWRRFSGDRDSQARLLKVTSPAALPGMFKNALSASLLVEMIRCISTFFLEDMALGVEYLQNLTKIARFDMVIMCLSSADKNDVNKIWDEVFSHCNEDYTEIICNLQPRFVMKL